LTLGASIGQCNIVGSSLTTVTLLASQKITPHQAYENLKDNIALSNSMTSAGGGVGNMGRTPKAGVEKVESVKIDGKILKYDDHALMRIRERNISESQLINTIKNGSQIKYNNSVGNVTGYRTSDGIYIAIGEDGTIITAIKNTSENYLINVQNKNLPIQ
jgi:hypothetical protein